MKLSKLLSICHVAIEYISSSLFDLCVSRIDFLPIEMLKGDKTTSWLGSDRNRITKVWCHMWWNFHEAIKNKHHNPLISTMKHASKMCLTYLKLHNVAIPGALEEKRKVL